MQEAEEQMLCTYEGLKFWCKQSVWLHAKLPDCAFSDEPPTSSHPSNTADLGTFLPCLTLILQCGTHPTC